VEAVSLESRIIYCLRKADEMATAGQLWIREAEKAAKTLGKRRRTLVRSSVTGKFASKKAAKANPRETVKERR
jgi:hypothetical protein